MKTEIILPELKMKIPYNVIAKHPESKMKIQYNVIAKHIVIGQEFCLSWWNNYEDAEESCWRYPATDSSYELRIEKVWAVK